MSSKNNNARSNAFNTTSKAYNPTTQYAGSSMANRGQASMDARSNAMNPTAKAYNPTSGKK